MIIGPCLPGKSHLSAIWGIAWVLVAFQICRGFCFVLGDRKQDSPEYFVN